MRFVDRLFKGCKYDLIVLKLYNFEIFYVNYIIQLIYLIINSQEKIVFLRDIN